MKNFFVFLFTFGVLFAQSDANSILKQLQDKYDSINSFTVNYSQSINGKRIISGKIIFKKENKYRIENKNQILGSDGINIWNYNSRQKKFIINNYDQNESSVYSINYLVYQLPDKCMLSARSEGTQQVLELQPKSTELQFQKIELWIGENKLINKIKLLDYNNQNTVISLSNYSINQNISDDNFSFNPPEGTKIIDLR